MSLQGKSLKVLRKILGGIGGVEILEKQPWDIGLHDLAGRVLDNMVSKPLPAFYRGSRFKAILDSERSGGLAQEMTHLLEADIFQENMFRDHNLSEDLAIVDDPYIPGIYGGFIWDGEGVKASSKVLLSREGINLLHSHLTAEKIFLEMLAKYIVSPDLDLAISSSILLTRMLRRSSMRSAEEYILEGWSGLNATQLLVE